MTVAKLMTRNPISVGPDTSVPEARAILKREKISRLPVLDKDNRLIGIATEYDMVNACPSAATSFDMWEMSYLLSKLKIEKVMSRNPITIDEDCTVEEAARIMADNNISGLPIMRENLLIGIITESDLFKLFTELFGARKKGIRATIVIPEKKGELALITAAIAKEGGNIIAMVTFLADDPSKSSCTIKVEGMSLEKFTAILAPMVEEISDIREI